MHGRREGCMEQSGLNLIRGVIGSYFCAAAFGMPVGFEPGFLFSLVLPSALAGVIGSGLVLMLAVTFVCGIMLRPVSLALVAVLILTCVGQTILGAVPVGAANLWQSCAFGAAILLCYAPLKPHELHKAALFSTVFVRGGAARVLQKDVTPRRVSARQAKTRRGDVVVRSLRPLIAPTEQMIGLSDGAVDDAAASRKRPKPFPETEDDLENIFVNL